MPAKRSATDEFSAQLQMLRCHVAENAYAFEAAAVQSIHRWEAVEPAAPRPGETGRGEIGRIHGRPVYPLARLLTLNEQAGAGDGPVLLLEDCAIQVDRVSRPVPVAKANLRSLPRPAGTATGQIQGLTRVDGELTLVLDPRRLTTAGGAGSARWPVDEPWTAQPVGKTDKLLCFSSPGHGQTYLAVSYRQAIEVAQGLTLTRLRTQQPWLAGLVDWRERAVPVVDVAGLLELEPSPVDIARVLIARAPRSGELFALPAAHLAPLPLPLSDDTMVVATIDPPSPQIRAAYLLTDGYLFLPDLDKLSGSEG